MKTSKKVLVAAVALFCLCVAPAASASEPPAADPVSRMASYVLGAMQQWSPPKIHRERSEEDVVATYRSVAEVVAQVAMDPAEPPLFSDDADRRKTALVIASLALHESGYKPYVMDGSCNDSAWRKAHPKMASPGGVAACDSGHAWGAWQIHPRQGRKFVALVGDGFAFEDSGFSGHDLVKDQSLGARVALHMARVSMRRNKNLAWYTGEIGKNHPKADARLNVALSYASTHPIN